MTLTPTPSTDWQEHVTPDEAQRHAEFSDQIQRLQTKLNGKYGPGRAFHASVDSDQLVFAAAKMLAPVPSAEAPVALWSTSCARTTRPGREAMRHFR